MQNAKMEIQLNIKTYLKQKHCNIYHLCLILSEKIIELYVNETYCSRRPNLAIFNRYP